MLYVIDNTFLKKPLLNKLYLYTPLSKLMFLSDLQPSKCCFDKNIFDVSLIILI